MTRIDPRYHGYSQRPGGSDSTQAGPMHLIGSPGEPDFITGFNMAPTDAIPNPVPMGYCLIVGRPNIMDGDQVLQYTEHKLEIVGDVDGVAPGDTVFVLPAEYRFPDDRPCHTHDFAGNYVPCRLYATGEFVYGVP